ncbi:uncharacterized protein LOC115235429 [Formica exsecta]|uniref:uncharacterized protein LOC115235429 n=1 Tax=Formica exsecta TaxID=72781 RepID=UPI001142011E|nr:uncharacterized protein LOC115235429 [Formica exsecta]XP_029663086.1 uncharacterized protein LOC115235429 [Formica exsecta]XP_029663087.1 uncharacterized protein LOC115235429 [Formica exsecta]XP_029663089.1 uncharacterized protein LOC115235429 [Formica exsecta]XP_029663090.1 uncharacterized protein LOC115235429 [Formica exsecta]
MVVSHREPSISSNIRAIIEQLNLNPVERRRLIDKTRQENNTRCKSFPDGIVTVESQTPKISIGVYGCKDRSTEFRVPDRPITMRKIEMERSRSKVDTRQRLPTQKKEAPPVCQVKIEAPSTQMEREVRMERVITNEGKLECRSIVTIGSFKKDTTLTKDDSRTRSTTMPVLTKILPTGQRIIKREHITRIDSCTIEDKIADASGVSIRPLYKIEDCVRSKKPDTATNARIPRATKEHMISKEQTRAEDMVEVIDPSISARARSP